MAPIEYPTLYDSWYECSKDAHTQSKKILATIGFKQVNDAQMGTKYNCRPVYTYWQCGRIVVRKILTFNSYPLTSLSG